MFRIYSTDKVIMESLVFIHIDYSKEERTNCLSELFSLVELFDSFQILFPG